MNYHNFDEDLMADLPSCVFGTGQHMTPIDNMNNLGTSVGIPTQNSRNPCNMPLMQRNSTTICPIPSANLQHHQYNQMSHHHHHQPGKFIVKKISKLNNQHDICLMTRVLTNPIKFFWMCVNNLDFMDSPSTSTQSPVNLSASANDINIIQNLNAPNNGNVGPSNNLSSFGGHNSPYKMQRQHQTAAARERKRVVRSAPNG